MFSKAKRFELVVPSKTQGKLAKHHEKAKLEKKEIEEDKPNFMKQEIEKPCLAKQDNENLKPKTKPNLKSATKATSSVKTNYDVQSQCSSAHSCKSFATPKPIKSTTNIKLPTSLKKPPSSLKKKPDLIVPKIKSDTNNEIIKSQEVEIRNKDQTISEYTKQIEEFKNRISQLEKEIKELTDNNVQKVDSQFSQLSLNVTDKEKVSDNENAVGNLNNKIFDLERLCEKLEAELAEKQLELRSVEEIIVIRDSLCQDLQQKLTTVETDLEETRQRLEMVKGHHDLALEANESIRREYKVELESLKAKLDEEKLAIINKSKSEQLSIQTTYNSLIETLKEQLLKEKDDAVEELHQELIHKENEIKAKLDQIDEATREKLRLCEIQFEERSRHIHDLNAQQQKEIQYLESELAQLKYNITLAEDDKMILQKEINNLQKDNNSLQMDKQNLTKEIDEIKEESKRKLIDFENEINKLTFEVDKAVKEKSKFETSLSVTRDIVQVLTMRLRESDNELETLEDQVQALTKSKEILENELVNYKTTLNSTVMECNEYKEALVNILKSKAALAKEHNRIMEHNVTLIESLQNVEKEAYRELGSIKNELIEDVEMLKKESNTQIKVLRDEVEEKRVLCELATEHAGQATAAAEQCRVLLAQAAAEINRLEAENQCLQQQIHDQQSLVVELSLLRQENEELTLTVAKQSSIIDKMKKETEQIQYNPKSPSVMRKSVKLGKENMQTVISPLRERNH